jgi:hypothetical protein
MAMRKKGLTSMEIWQNKIRALRRYLRGWGKCKWEIQEGKEGAHEQTGTVR